MNEGSEANKKGDCILCTTRRGCHSWTALSLSDPELGTFGPGFAILPTTRPNSSLLMSAPASRAATWNISSWVGLVFFDIEMSRMNYNLIFIVRV